ncbi:unnamed protein product [Closterium sp. NIES-53]
MAAQELRWLTYLLTDLGERPRSPPVLYVDNKAAIALCQEHRLEHITKHIALRYFLSRELQQCGQLRLTYVATRANTADIFTKALSPGDHQPSFALPDWSCDPVLPHSVYGGVANICISIDDSGNCSIASQLCVIAVALLFGESKLRLKEIWLLSPPPLKCPRL